MIEIQLPDLFLENLDLIVKRVEQASEAANRSLEFTKNLVSETGVVYSGLSDELKQQRILLDDMRDRLHALGNMMNGKIGAYELQLFTKQIVEESLREHKLI